MILHMWKQMKKFKYYHWIVWITSVFYSLWKFKKSSEDHFFSLSHSDFDKGWSIINRLKDSSDFEWTVLTSTFKKYYILFIFQLILSKILRRIHRNLLPFFYASYSIFCCTVIVGDKATIFFISYIIGMCVIHFAGKKSICYILTTIALMLKHSSYILNFKELIVDSEVESFLVDVALAWIIAKALSFMIDRINLCIHKRVTIVDISLIFSYCLYLPSFFTGPLISYEQFIEQMLKTNSSSSYKTTMSKIKHLIYILLWYFVFEIMLHYIYSSSIQYYPEVVSHFDSWSLCGLGYALPVMFYLKYFIIYSIAQNIAAFEDFDFPPPPKCISCIHSSSYLWRHFDRGLYLWILKYLYYPLSSGKYSLIRKAYSVAFCFGFICLWHNIDQAICMWTFLNFILVSSEMLMYKYILHSRRIEKIHAFLVTPHFIMMCISCTFFLANWKIGVLLFKRVMLTGIIPFIPIFLIMCCGCQVSIDVRKWEKIH